MKNLILILFLISTTTYAQEHQAKPKLIFFDEDVDKAEAQKSYDVETPVPSSFALPNLSERDKFFEGIAFPTNWDDLKKDIFFLELKAKSITELVKKYPELKESDIKSLKAKKNE